MKMKWLGILFAALLVIGFVAGCGASEQPATDGTTAASIVADEAAFTAAVSEDGTWIIAALNDITVGEELELAGEFTNRDEVVRKIALYEQDEDRNITDRHTLTIPRLVVSSENARIQGGTLAGDVFVQADGFRLIDATIDGNLVFANAGFEASADLSEGTVTGDITVE